MSKKILVVVDGLAMVYRSFYAVPPLTTSTGFSTNAILGFIKAVNQIRANWHPSHWCVVFDGGLPALRMELAPEYKAQRPSMPDELREQVEAIKEYLTLASIPWFRIEGEEADDVIAAIVTRAEKQADRVLICTRDKDLFQLVNSKVCVFSGMSNDKLMDVAAVEEKTGVQPSQVAEWLAITGDSSDNIKGVPGVGPKTAAKLLRKYGSLEKIWADINSLENEKLRRKMLENREIISRNLKITSLNHDAKSDFDWADIRIQKTEEGKILPFLERYELKSLMTKIVKN